MNASVLINQTSGEVEWYTPLFIIEAARKTMGSIRLDPASSRAANNIVNAGNYFSKEDDGLNHQWRAETVWLNHPFHKGEDICPVPYETCTKDSCKKRGYHIDERIPSNADWINKLIEGWSECHFSQACCITYACTSETWFQPLMIFPQCFLSPRTNYLLADGTKKPGVTKGSVVTYLGQNNDRFHEAFKDLGTVKVRYPCTSLPSEKL